MRDLDQNLMLFFTGYSRAASEVLEDQKTRCHEGDEEMLANLAVHQEVYVLKIKRIVGERRLDLAFASLMHELWMHKKVRSAMITNGRIFDLNDHARDTWQAGR